MDSITFYTVSLKKPSNLYPEWKRTIGYTNEKSCYLPIEIFGNEPILLLKLAFDGQPMAGYKNHIFASSDWLKAELPEKSKVIEEIVSIFLKKLKHYSTKA